eukprot:gnl/Trimastix_PCT/861.p1 GENE.gnl/Trimastix_PCT/861~~gnl/Trimastix_PCT/861.p1  ORF type:complete len:1019 (-),score=442.67 gnl/Trimastix_PCT/861:128-3184(-)
MISPRMPVLSEEIEEGTTEKGATCGSNLRGCPPKHLVPRFFSLLPSFFFFFFSFLFFFFFFSYHNGRQQRGSSRTVEPMNAPELGVPEFQKLGILNERNQKLTEDVHRKEERIHNIGAQIEGIKERKRVMETFLGDVKQQRAQTKQLVDAKTRESDGESHLKQIADRQLGRARTEMAHLTKQSDEMEEKHSVLQNNVFRAKDQLETAKSEINLNQQQLDQWIVANRQKEEDSLAIERYQRQDEQRVRELSLQLERLTRECQAKKRDLDNEVTETQAAQIELDKTAEEFQQLHRERQRLIGQWEEVLKSLHDRDQSIQHNRELFADGKERQAELSAQRDSLQKELEQQQATNREIEAKSKVGDTLLNRLRADYGAAKNSVSELDDEVMVVRNTVVKAKIDLQNKIAGNERLRGEIEAQEERLARQQGILEDRMQRLHVEEDITKTRNSQTTEIEREYRTVEEQNRAIDKSLKDLKEEMFRHHQTLFKARQDNYNVIAEINGAQASIKNLQAKIRKLDAEAMKQRELIYQADFQIQLLERRVPRAEGHRTDEEKQILTKQIQDLTKRLDKQTQHHARLTQQSRRLEDELRHANRRVTQNQKTIDSLSSKIADLKLSNENANRDVQQSVGRKEDLAVSHDVLKLEIKRLRDLLNSRVDEVCSLENRRFQLQMTIQERETEISLHTDLLRAEQRGHDEDRHKIAMELKERQVKVDKLRTKFQTIIGVRGGDSEEETEHTQAFHMVQAAQRRQQLEKQGDELDALIRKKQEEVTKLENTMRHMTGQTDDYRNSFHQADRSSSEFEEKQALEDQLRQVTDRSRAARQEITELRNHIQFLEGALRDKEKEQGEIEPSVQELEQRKAQLSADVAAQGPKIERAQKQMARAAREHRRRLGLDEATESEAERDFQLMELKETNQVILSSIMQLGRQYPEVGAALPGILERHGIKRPGPAPSRPGSARSTDSQRSSTSSRGRVSASPARPSATPQSRASASSAGSRGSQSAMRPPARRTSAARTTSTRR